MGMEIAFWNKLFLVLHFVLVLRFFIGLFNDLEFNFNVFSKLGEQLLDLKWL